MDAETASFTQKLLTDLTVFLRVILFTFLTDDASPWLALFCELWVGFEMGKAARRAEYLF